MRSLQLGDAEASAALGPRGSILQAALQLTTMSVIRDLPRSSEQRTKSPLPKSWWPAASTQVPRPDAASGSGGPAEQRDQRAQKRARGHRPIGEARGSEPTEAEFTSWSNSWLTTEFWSTGSQKGQDIWCSLCNRWADGQHISSSRHVSRVKEHGRKPESHKGEDAKAEQKRILDDGGLLTPETWTSFSVRSEPHGASPPRFGFPHQAPAAGSHYKGGFTLCISLSETLPCSWPLDVHSVGRIAVSLVPSETIGGGRASNWIRRRPPRRVNNVCKGCKTWAPLSLSDLSLDERLEQGVLAQPQEITCAFPLNGRHAGWLCDSQACTVGDVTHFLATNPIIMLVGYYFLAVREVESWARWGLSNVSYLCIAPGNEALFRRHDEWRGGASREECEAECALIMARLDSLAQVLVEITADVSRLRDMCRGEAPAKRRRLQEQPGPPSLEGSAK